MTAEVWTIKRMVQWCEEYLENKGDVDPRGSTRWLVLDACNMSRIELFMNLDKELTQAQLDTLHNYIARRATGEPLQYITGKTTFRYIDVYVEPGVLIPRPETEVLVSEALAALPRAKRQTFDDDLVAALAKHADDAIQVIESDDETSSNEAYKQLFEEARAHELSQSESEGLLVADICTGSGCIACSIADEHPSTNIVATDIDPRAVQLAKKNVSALGFDDRIGVLQSDLGQSIPSRYLGSFDLVISNPPYIPSKVVDTLSSEVVDFESRLALDGGDDGLIIFDKLLAWSKTALKPGGVLAVELHETCLDEAALRASKAGYNNVSIIKDLTDRPRVLVAYKPV